MRSFLFVPADSERKIEKALNAYPGVASARVNLTLKRASIQAGTNITAAELVGKTMSMLGQ